MSIHSKINSLERQVKKRFKPKYDSITVTIGEWHEYDCNCSECLENALLPAREYLENGDIIINVGVSDEY